MRYLGEIGRKATHIAALVVPVMFICLARDLALPIVALAALIALIHDFLRIHHPGFQRFIYRLWGKIYRSWESKRLGGSSYILAGATMALFLCEQHIAALVMVYIIIGDTAAVFVGKLWGRHIIYKRRNPDGTFRKKTIEGTFSFFLTAFIFSLFVPGVPPIWKFIGALTATVVELISFFIDDNFTVPVFVGILLQLGIHGELVPFV